MPRPSYFHLICALVIACLATNVKADDTGAPITYRPGPDGQPVQVSPNPGGDANQPPGSNSPGKSGNPGDSSQPPGSDKPKDGDAKESAEPKVIRRGDHHKEDTESDPNELKATVGEDGKVAFQFRNQSWVGLIQWLADISDQPLDWQELPGDRVNLRSPGRYTVDETKDLFNRHLLSRGYTMLQMPGGMTVVKTENINPAIVPRVAVDQLDELQPNTFVRTSLDVGWLSAEKLAKELTPMISTNGRLTALTTTNRIEAMDAAVNLKQVATLLDRERDSVSREALAPEFKLRYIPAEDAKKMLEEFLGVEKKEAGPMTPQQMQAMQRMQQQNGGQPMPEKKEVDVSIVANVRQNSVIIRAPVDRIAVASEFINRIDVPGQSMMSLADVESRVAVFRLYSLDPEKLIEIISEMNVLEPSTRVRTDSDNNAVIVNGGAADRFIIEKLIARLDGSGRKFEVLQLRRLDANEVAESIGFLMGKDKDKDDSNSSSRRYSYYGYGFGDQSESKKDEDEFRVAANAQYRQVLLWANETEMEQVTNLLVKLGELPPPGGSQRTYRRIDAAATPETYEYLQQIRKQWERMSGNPLELPDKEAFAEPDESKSSASDSSKDEDKPIEIEESKDKSESETPEAESDKPKAGEKRVLDETITHLAPSVGDLADNPFQPPVSSEQFLTNVLQDGSPTQGSDDSTDQPTIQSAADFDRAFGGPAAADSKTNEKTDSATAAQKSAIRIELDARGNLILNSDDTEALDRLEDLMMQIQPPKRPYHVFQIEHGSAYIIKLNLEEYFADEEEGNDEADRLYRWWYDLDQEEESGPSGLGKNNSLRIVEDPDTKTLVVSGATDEQLKIITELIELWDVPDESSSARMRYTQLVTLEWGKAQKISDTIKEAYRDLLSSNDKTFSGGGGGGNRGGGEEGQDQKKRRDDSGSGLVDKENGRDGGGADFSFKGKLSIGVDEIGNTLLISAEGESLLGLVVEMVAKLDKASKPAGAVEVITLSGLTSEASIRSALKALGAQVDTTEASPQAPANDGKE
ncbi:secretin N-terminal domain-containing protein [Stieleria varia]|uniref:Bacterial type II/III secretion system short domain protein n=1 Tax=Stieleria varia TaxID=2528005 RepID=A0A5C6AZG6_9BACT|nr:secretin N-terminal domain-containing protein [Stieleria varia]TWU04559.1 Bacterial type II/III secretion system short domain protein [Stieleria varia]